VYAPGADTGEEMLTHAGQEAGVVIEGEIELTVGEQSRLLKSGDGYYFDSSIPHRFRNPGRVQAVLVSASLASGNGSAGF
jgi:mannose-6-phosphate isomerase-like protein (cupin superfamily)